MAVLAATAFVVKPDGMESFLKDIQTAKPLIEKAGARNVRLMSAVVAGEATGGMVFSVEVDDFAGFGAYLDAYMTDPELAAMFASVNTSGSSVASWQATLWVDVPL